MLFPSQRFTGLLSSLRGFHANTNAQNMFHDMFAFHSTDSIRIDYLFRSRTAQMRPCFSLSNRICSGNTIENHIAEYIYNPIPLYEISTKPENVYLMLPYKFIKFYVCVCALAEHCNFVTCAQPTFVCFDHFGMNSHIYIFPGLFHCFFRQQQQR